MTKPIQIQFDPVAREALEKLQAETCAPDLAAVGRSAVGLYQWALERRQGGYRIGAFDNDGPVFEVNLDAWK